MIKTGIYYFTGTGNSLSIARDLAKEIGDADIISIPAALKGTINTTYDKIGIVFPVYFYGVPLIVADFIKRMDRAEYIFAVANYGSNPGGTFPQIQKLLKLKDMKLSAGFGIQMPDNYIPMFSLSSEEKRDEVLKNKTGIISEIASIIKSSKEVGYLRRSILSEYSGSLVYRIFSPRFHSYDKKFRTDISCSGCGICSRICPVENIRLSGGRPQWNHKCQWCLACIHACPTASIQAGKQTKKRGRYRNPDIKLEELLISKE